MSKSYLSPVINNLSLVAFIVKFLLILKLNLLSSSGSVSQLFVVPVSPEKGDEHIQYVRNLLSANEIGGLIFMAGNLEVQHSLTQEFTQLQYPPLIFQDAEWGTGMRLKDVPSLPRQMTLAATGDLNLMRAYGLELAHQCRSAGVDIDFAPVCDVNINPKNPVIGSRSLGDDPQQVAQMARAIYQGMREGGLGGCAKHFPGHGDTHVDSHLSLPIIDALVTEPFEALIDEEVELVMMGHLLFPEIDQLPSSLSSEHIQGVLREKLGFEGVVISDALNMGALQGYKSIGELCEQALLAGNDLLLFASANRAFLNWIVQEGIPEAIAYLEERIPLELIEEKLARVNQLRNQIRPPIPPANTELTRDIYRRAVTAIGELPRMGDVVTLVRNGEDPTFERALASYAQVKVVSKEALDSSDSCIIFEQTKGDSFEHIPDHAIVGLFDLPYALNHTNALIGYEPHPDAKEAVADALFGHLTPLGKLPIQVCE